MLLIYPKNFLLGIIRHHCFCFNLELSAWPRCSPCPLLRPECGLLLCLHYKSDVSYPDDSGLIFSLLACSASHSCNCFFFSLAKMRVSSCARFIACSLEVFSHFLTKQVGAGLACCFRHIGPWLILLHQLCLQHIIIYVLIYFLKHMMTGHCIVPQRFLTHICLDHHGQLSPIFSHKECALLLCNSIFIYGITWLYLVQPEQLPN